MSQYLSVETIKRLLGQPQNDSAKGIRDRAILRLMALHNLRVSEIASLDVDDLDVRAGILQAGGNGRKRTIALSAVTLAALRPWLTARQLWADCPALFVALPPAPVPGRRLSARALRMVVDGYLEAINAKSSGTSCDMIRLSVREAARTNPISVGTLVE
jgi:integrase/recombinase XerC